jgi:hypothetical protein
MSIVWTASILLCEYCAEEDPDFDERDLDLDFFDFSFFSLLLLVPSCREDLELEDDEEDDDVF